MGSFLIRFCLRGMLSAVQLNYQATFKAAKIDNKTVNRILASKLKTTKLIGAKPRPESPLRFSLIATQSAGAITQYCGVWFHCSLPSPLPSPSRRGNFETNPKSKMGSAFRTDGQRDRKSGSLSFFA